MAQSSGGLPPVVDTHFHLDHPQFAGEAAAVWERARAAGVRWGVTIGTDPDESGPKVLELAARLPDLHVAVGLHPHEADKGADTDLWSRLERLARQPQVVAVGETGLDHHYDFGSRPRQQEAFQRQLALAQRLNLPLVLHVRDAYEEALALLAREGPPRRGGVFHSFSGGPDVAQACMDLGFYLGFGGLVTFATTHDIQAAASRVRGDRILLETDAPYLAPAPRRGRRNEPALVRLVLTRLAQLRDEPVDALARQTCENARRLLLARAPARPGDGS